jgi:ABC-type uncharacterized transport system substrate-binding protein
VRGGALALHGVGGILPYNIEESLNLIAALGMAPLGIAFTAGYAGVAAVVEAGAKARGIKLIKRAIDVRGDVGPAVRDLTREARIVWLLGDPLLSRGAGFQFLVEQSLASHVPVIAPTRWEVEHGALIGSDPDWTAMATLAGTGLRERFAAGSTVLDDRIVGAPAGGTFLVNRTLIAEWGIPMPSGTAWKGIR